MANASIHNASIDSVCGSGTTVGRPRPGSEGPMKSGMRFSQLRVLRRVNRMVISGNLPKTGTLIRVLMGGSFERGGVDSFGFTGRGPRISFGRLIRFPFHLLHGHMISKQLPGL